MEITTADAMDLLDICKCEPVSLTHAQFFTRSVIEPVFHPIDILWG